MYHRVYCLIPPRPSRHYSITRVSRPEDDACERPLRTDGKMHVRVMHAVISGVVTDVKSCVVVRVHTPIWKLVWLAYVAARSWDEKTRAKQSLEPNS